MSLHRVPDEDRDVIVHYIGTARHAGTARHDGNPDGFWMLWLGRERRGDYPTQEEAFVAARRLSAMTGRPAWLLVEKGRPLEPI
jgi:hypothetical protein